MKTRILIMRPGQSHETAEIELSKQPGYETLRDVIQPYLPERACLEHCSVWADFDGGTKYRALDMFVDDRGLCKGLPRNEAATILYRRANQMGLTAVPKVADPEMLNFIVGPAILFDRRVWF